MSAQEAIRELDNSAIEFYDAVKRKLDGQYVSDLVLHQLAEVHHRVFNDHLGLLRPSQDSPKYKLWEKEISKNRRLRSELLVG